MQWRKAQLISRHPAENKCDDETLRCLLVTGTFKFKTRFKIAKHNGDSHDFAYEW